MSVNEDMLFCMVGIEFDVDLNSSVVKGCAVTAKDGTIINTEEWIKFMGFDGQVAFIFSYFICNFKL